MMILIRTDHLIRSALRRLAWCMTLVGSAVCAQDSVSSKVLVGMSTPLSGPDAAYGLGLAQGVRAAIANANEKGDGSRIELMLLDDAGQPDRAIENTRSLLQAKAVALTGYHGSAVVEAVIPILDRGTTPMVGAASSAEVLREPVRRWLFNLRAGATEETAAIVYHLDTIGIDQIAAIVQSDGLGQAGHDSVRSELVRIGMRLVSSAEVPFQASSRDVHEAVRKVCSANPQAVLLALNAAGALVAMRQARQLKCRPQFYVLSETASGLSSAGASASDLAGVVVSQVLPSPQRPAHPLVADYLHDVSKVQGGLPSYAGLEGYLYGRTLTAAIRACGRHVTGECVIQVLERGRIGVPGYRLQFARDQRRGSTFVELTMFGSDGALRR